MLLQKFQDRCRRRSLERALMFSEEGLALGVTLLAKFADGRLQMDETRVLALLSVAYGEHFSGHTLAYIRAAEKARLRGDADLAGMHLALALPRTRFEPVRSYDLAYRIFEAEEMLQCNVTPCELLKHFGLAKDDDEI